MEFTTLGRSAVRVSRLCLGTMNIGPQIAERDAHALLDAATDAGINFVDTANRYGGDGHWGRTETILGRWFALGGGRRERTVLATKGFAPMSDDPNDGGLSARAIRHACDASLQRLGVDHVDLYQMHHVDRSARWDEVWQALELLIAQGKILYVGSSNFAGWHLADAQARARERGALGLVSEQSLYNLLTRHAELEVLPAARHLGIGLLPWSPLHGGALAGPSEGGVRRNAGRAAAGRAAASVALERYWALCDELGRAPAEVALAWVAQQPGVTAPVVGPRTHEQLRSALAAVEHPLDAAALERLDEIFPPFKPAPEHYAW